MSAYLSPTRRILVFILVTTACIVASPLQGAVEELEEIVVSGVKDPRRGSLISSGSSRIAFPAEIVGPLTSVGEMVGHLPGVAVNGQGGIFQSYSLRGFSRSRIRTEVSGVPIISDRRAGNSLSFLPEDFIDTIRADMGPASSLYGSGAMGGVLSVSLKNPEQTTLKLGLGSAGRQRSLGLQTRLNNETALSVVVRAADESRSPNNEPLNGGFHQSAIYIRNAQKVGDFLINSEVIASSGTDLGKSTAFFPEERISTYPHDKHTIVNLRATNQSGWYAQGYIHDQNWASRTERIGVRENTSRYGSHTYGALLSRRQSSELGQNRWGLELTARTNVEITEVETSLLGNSASLRLVDDGSEWVSGAFADRLWFLGGATVRTGVRLDRARVENGSSSRSETKLNGQLQFETSFQGSWLVAVELGTAYRLPTLSELYFSGETPRGTVLGNPLLAAEETLGTQITLSRQTDNLTFEIGGFFNRVDDYIERVRAAGDVLTYQNLRSGDVWGFDGLASYSNEHIEHRIQWQWQRGAANTGEFLDDLPPPKVSYTGTWRQGPMTLAIDVGYRFNREDYGPGERPLSSSLIGAARVDWKVSPHWSASISLSNGFDRSYRTSADEDAPLANERAVHITLNWTPSASG